MNKKIQITITLYILLCILLSSVFVLAEDTQTDYSKSDKADTTIFQTIQRGTGAWINPLNTNYEGWEQLEFSSWLTYEHASLLEPIPEWNPVDDWEIQQCSLKLTSEMDMQEASPLQGTGFFMGEDTAITMQAKTSFYGNISRANYFENSLGYFVEPFNEVVLFSIEVYYADGSKEIIVEEGEAEVGGTSDFIAWTTATPLEQAKLIPEDGTQPFVVTAVQEDKSK